MVKPVEIIMNREYLLTNGLGGYSFSSLDEVNCRKYHSLYTVSENPPVQRMHLVAKMVPTVRIGDRTVRFTDENERGCPETDSALTAYSKEGVVRQTFVSEGVKLVKTSAFLYGTHEFAVAYEVSVDAPAVLTLEPWFHFRDHHDVMPIDVEAYSVEWLPSEGLLTVSNGDRKVYLKTDGHFEADRLTTPISYYPIETRRGYPDSEQNAVLGRWTYPISKGVTQVTVGLNIEPSFTAPETVLESAKVRYKALTERAEFKNGAVNRLVQAADDFIVWRQNTGKKTIIAGYPWFTDWGRDTMIALPGLTLSTKRYDEGLEMIEGFLSKVYKGIIPNNFPDEGEAPMYNTSDGTLWLFNAVYAYYERTGDAASVKRLLPDLLGILSHHMAGTINDIYMDTDGLLSTGNETTQLTWMDVKVDGWVVTPRHGKAVEINALWYNALSITAHLTKALEVATDIDFDALIPKVKQAFNETFWCEEAGILYDLVIDGVPHNIPRPNMLFAVSLPFPVLEKARFKSVVDFVTAHLKVPYGLLTLTPSDPDFKGRYGGDLLSRDGAYHRGTAWAWLLGAYFDAHYKAYGDKEAILKEIQHFFKHLEEGVLGSASEIFEGDAPHAQRGCPAQAWSVAEVLRVYEALGLDALVL